MPSIVISSCKDTTTNSDKNCENRAFVQEATNNSSNKQQADSLGFGTLPTNPSSVLDETKFVVSSVAPTSSETQLDEDDDDDNPLRKNFFKVDLDSMREGGPVSPPAPLLINNKRRADLAMATLEHHHHQPLHFVHQHYHQQQPMPPPPVMASQMSKQTAFRQNPAGGFFSHSYDHAYHNRVNLNCGNKISFDPNLIMNIIPPSYMAAAPYSSGSSNVILSDCGHSFLSNHANYDNNYDNNNNNNARLYGACGGGTSSSVFQAVIDEASEAVYDYLIKTGVGVVKEPLVVGQLIDRVSELDCIEDMDEDKLVLVADYQPITKYTIENEMLISKENSAQNLYVNNGRKNLKRTTSV
jgi:hypothetical protein